MSASRIQSLLPERQSEINLLAWLGQAGFGEALEYHQGFLALDRSLSVEATKDADQRALCQVATRAMRLADQGLVHLLQRRICRDRFSYLVIARPRTPTNPLATQTLMSEENV